MKHACNWQVVRRQGNRVRHQCTECLTMDRWTKAVQYHPDVHPDVSPDVSPDVPVITPSEPMTDLTVSQLRALCKDRGITGYSKMRRDELIDTLASLNGSNG